MAEKPVDHPSTDDGASADDTIDLAQQPIMGTAEFKALVELQAELYDDDDGRETTHEAPDEDDDLLSITDQLEKLREADDEDDPGFDPYDRGPQE